MERVNYTEPPLRRPSAAFAIYYLYRDRCKLTSLMAWVTLTQHPPHRWWRFQPLVDFLWDLQLDERSDGLRLRYPLSAKRWLRTDMFDGVGEVHPAFLHSKWGCRPSRRLSAWPEEKWALRRPSGAFATRYLHSLKCCNSIGQRCRRPVALCRVAIGRWNMWNVLNECSDGLRPPLLPVPFTFWNPAILLVSFIDCL